MRRGRDEGLGMVQKGALVLDAAQEQISAALAQQCNPGGGGGASGGKGQGGGGPAGGAAKAQGHGLGVRGESAAPGSEWQRVLDYVRGGRV